MSEQNRDSLAELDDLLRDVPEVNVPEIDSYIDEILSEYGTGKAAEPLAAAVAAPPPPEPVPEMAAFAELTELDEMEDTTPIPPTVPLPVIEPKTAPGPKEPSARAVSQAAAGKPKPAAPKPPKAEPVPPPPPPPEEFFGPKEHFEAAFSPSEQYTGPIRDLRDERPPSVPFGERLRGFVRSRRKIRPVRPSLPVQEAAARIAPHVRGATLRCFVVALLALALLLITFAERFGWALPGLPTYTPTHAYVYLLVVSVAQILCMILAVDVLAVGLQDILRLRPGMESLLLISCLATLAQVATVVMFDGWIGYRPYCVCNALSLAFALWGHRQHMEACRRSYHTASMVSDPMLIYREEKLWEEHDCYTKGEGTTDDFVQRTESPDLARKFAAFFAPLVLVASVVAAFLASVGQGRGENFFWAFSAITTAATPFVSAMVFALPFLRVAKRLSKSGAALAGWIAAAAFDEDACVVLTDTDLFPAGTITLSQLKVFGSYSFDLLFSYAVSLAAASGSGLLRVFEELNQKSQNPLRPVSDFRHHEGGYGGEINGDRLLMGGANFIISMGIRLPKELNVKNAIYVAVNHDLAGIFAINYMGAKNVSHALLALRRQKIVQILAVRDFNITLPVVCGRYRNAEEEMLRYPVVEERLALSETAHDPYVRPLAAVTREGLEPFAECVAGGIRLRRVARINLLLYGVSAVVGLALAFYLTYSNEAALLSPMNLSLFLLLWCVPVALVSALADRY